MKKRAEKNNNYKAKGSAGHSIQEEKKVRKNR